MELTMDDQIKSEIEKIFDAAMLKIFDHSLVVKGIKEQFKEVEEVQRRVFEMESLLDGNWCWAMQWANELDIDFEKVIIRLTDLGFDFSEIAARHNNYKN